MSEQQAIDILERAAAELAAIERRREFVRWRGDTIQSLDRPLAFTEPFARFANAWIFIGDGAGRVMNGRFGAWTIDRLAAGKSPREVLDELAQQADSNRATYGEVSAVCGVRVEEDVELEPGVTLSPGRGTGGWHARRLDAADGYFAEKFPADAALLTIDYAVTPAFELRDSQQTPASITAPAVPDSETRRAIRDRVRSALLLAVDSSVELPEWTIVADPHELFAADGGVFGQMMASYALVSTPVDAALARRNYAALAEFATGDGPARGSLARAIDRLGRSRLAVSPVDRALDLGIAAEIALSHEAGGGTGEITYKIGTRAAWLLGTDPASRQATFEQIRDLYKARSQAAHMGILSSAAKVDLDACDTIISQALTAILLRGSFPDWSVLTLGG